MMDETHGGRAYNVDPLSIDGQNFQPLESTQLIDELHKLFQSVDSGGKGFVTKDELQDFQLLIAKKEDLKLSTQDKTQLITTFLIQTTNQSGQSIGGSSAQQAAYLINWTAFRDTLIDWITSQSHLNLTLFDQGGHMTQKDKINLHSVISSLFLATHSEKRNEILLKAHLGTENIERDMESITIYGTPISNSFQTKIDCLNLSKLQANNFSIILQEIGRQDVSAVMSGITRLREIFDVLCVYTYKFELLEIQDHLRRIFDLVLSSTLFDTFHTILDTPEDSNLAAIKLEVLRCIGLLSIGVKLFSNSDASIAQEQDSFLLQKLQERLLNFDLQVKVINQLASLCIELRDQSFLVLGYYLKNGLDISNMLFERDALDYIFQQIVPNQSQTSLLYISWLLFLINKRYYLPGIFLTDKQRDYINRMQNKLMELLFREDLTDNLAICIFLAFGRILHVCPPSEQIFQVIQCATSIISNQTGSLIIQQSALKCIYYTVKFSRIHKEEFNQVKLIQILGGILDKNMDEKLSLMSLLTLKELAINGFQAQMVDITLFSSLMRIMTMQDSHLYFICLEILQLLVEASVYCLNNISNFGFLRCICGMLSEFRVYKDYPIQSVYDINPQQENGGLGTGMPRFGGSPARKTQGYLSLYSYGLLDKSIQTLDFFLALMVNKQQISQCFTLDLLEKFKPIIDMISNQLKLMQTPDSYKLDVTMKLKTFFYNYRVKTYNIGNIQDETYQLANFVCQFLEDILTRHIIQSQYSSTPYIPQGNQLGYFQQQPFMTGQPPSILLVKCIDQSSSFEDNKLFEVPSSINYRDLQELVNKKYNNLPMQISFIDEQGEAITIDSDLVLQKANRLAIQAAHQNGERDVMLRLIVHKLTHCNIKNSYLKYSTIEYFQCFECGGQFARDPRQDYGVAGSINCCTECYHLISRQQS